MNVVDNGKANAGKKTGDTLKSDAVGQRCLTDGDAVDEISNIPRSGHAQCDCNGDQKHLHDAVDAGIGIAVDDITHCIGEQKTRHQQHERTDVDHVRTDARNERCAEIGQEGHREGGGNGFEKGIGIQMIQSVVGKTDDQTAQGG